MASSFALFLSIILLLVVLTCNYNKAQGRGGDSGEEQHQKCNSSSCGNLLNISYPFRLKDDPSSCGDRSYELSCEDNRTILYLYDGKYYVKGISYDNLTLQIVDTGLQEHNCSSLPLHSLTRSNFGYKDPYRLSYRLDYDTFVLMHCGFPVNSALYVDTSPCINGSDEYSSYKTHSYAYLGADLSARVRDIEESCNVDLMVLIPRDGVGVGGSNRSFSDKHHKLLMGVELSWSNLLCRGCYARGHYCAVIQDFIHDFHPIPIISCYRDCRHPFQSFPCFLQITGYLILELLIQSGTIIEYIMAGRVSCGIIGLSAFLIYKFRRRHLSMDESIEDFLRSHNNLVPIRYSYSEIKKITKNFKNKLGQGGYGSVFKGKLRSGRFVAVKILSKSKTNGQEFINEVATIGRIHHVNVVRLVGFCVEGSKRALIYDFMPNGSLEKYIFCEGKDSNSLSWEKMYDIALGAARGIEYLHRGCDMQILHFDIKPHNILLDKNFIPKVSDFGLAKLYPVDDSIVSLTAARGTIGYIAPELFYKNIGGVSYKADVYSFGMLLLEMVGRRKNVNPFVENSSQIYFPDWIYERLNRGDQEIEIEDDGDEDEKMIVINTFIEKITLIIN